MKLYYILGKLETLLDLGNIKRFPDVNYLQYYPLIPAGYHHVFQNILFPPAYFSYEISRKKLHLPIGGRRIVLPRIGGEVRGKCFPDKLSY
jgi:hypothetical protein